LDKYERTLSQLQKIGDEILEKHNKNNFYYEVGIEYIIEAGFGIHIEAEPLKERYGVEAFPAIGKSIIYIDISLMDDSRQERRYRFTLAEELAHIILHSDIYKEVKTFNDYFKAERSISEDSYHRLDRNAKELAGIILMPRYTFINRAIEIRNDLCRSKAKDKNSLTDIEKNKARNQIVRILMDDFNVNQEPCEIRLERIEKGLNCSLFEMSLDKSFLKKRKP